MAGKNLLAFYLEQQGPDSGVQQALPAKITTVADNRACGQKLTINIPANLQQPAPGVYSTLIQIKNSLGLKSGKNALIKSIGCPRPASTRSASRSPTCRTRTRRHLLGLLGGRRPCSGKAP